MEKNQDALARQVELLSRAYPGRLTLTVGEGCAALSIRKKTFFVRAARGRAPFPVRKQGHRYVVLIEDLARAALGLPVVEPRPEPAAPGLEQQVGGRRGRPSNTEKLEAARLGVTVAELRARRAGREAQQ